MLPALATEPSQSHGDWPVERDHVQPRLSRSRLALGGGRLCRRCLGRSPAGGQGGLCSADCGPAPVAEGVLAGAAWPQCPGTASWQDRPLAQGLWLCPEAETGPGSWTRPAHPGLCHTWDEGSWDTDTRESGQNLVSSARCWSRRLHVASGASRSPVFTSGGRVSARSTNCAVICWSSAPGLFISQVCAAFWPCLL